MLPAGFLFLNISIARGQDSIPIGKKMVNPAVLVNNFRLPKSLLKDSLRKKIITKPVFTFPSFSSPFIALTGGRVDYSFYYRSNTDTPYFEKNTYQHQINTTVKLLAGNLLPFNVRSLIRRTNSLFFRDITDVQVEFDAQSFQQNIYSNSLNNLRQYANQYKDSLSNLDARKKLFDYSQFLAQFQNFFTVQKLVEANELLNVPEVTWDKNLSDSAAQIKSDSLKKGATKFMRLYSESKNSLDSLRKVFDSVSAVYTKLVMEADKLRSLSEQRPGNPGQFNDIEGQTVLKKKGIELIPAKYRWLLGIRKFNLGRTTLNYSELTVKNTSLNGISLEYNTWFYLAFSAGLVDFRFQDFAVHNSAKIKQYLYIGRVGIGRLNKNFLILSLFNGTKQRFSLEGLNSFYKFTVTGVSLEGKYQFNRNGYAKGEVAESVSPDFRAIPLKNNSWSLKGKTDKAYALVAQYNIPVLQAKVDGYYKYTGANFQSFSTFQSNATVNAYSLKWEQHLFKRQLKITAGIKTNEFSNPYLMEQYTSNTVFKSFQATFRKRRWPVLTASYMPLSQLTVVGGIVYENKFNSLNANIYHTYKIGAVNCMSTLMFSRFYNNAVDTGFIYFNSRNIIFNQSLATQFFTTSLNISNSINRGYQFSVVDESIQVPFRKTGNLLFGAKIHHLNNLNPLMGYYASLRMPVSRHMSISLLYDNGYLPGSKGTLIKNNTGNIQLSKSF